MSRQGQQDKAVLRTVHQRPGSFGRPACRRSMTCTAGAVATARPFRQAGGTGAGLQQVQHAQQELTRHLEGRTQQQIGAQAALVGLIEDQAAVGAQQEVALQLAQQDAVRHELDGRPGRALHVVPDLRQCSAVSAPPGDACRHNSPCWGVKTKQQGLSSTDTWLRGTGRSLCSMSAQSAALWPVSVYSTSYAPGHRMAQQSD